MPDSSPAPSPSAPRDAKAPAKDALVGTQIGPFTIVRRIGEGGMGAVFLARQEKPAREVALKLLRSPVVSERLLRRFELEAEMLGRLHHPGIAQVHQAGTFETPQGKQPYFAMEYVEGEPIDVYARLRSLALPERLELAARVCDAVQHAHQKGLVHRDLKPGNILVTADGQPKILDFGVARATGSDSELTAHTEAGDLVGTLAYMSPEQVGGDPDELDTRSDVYALGVVIYELLTGKLPFAIDRKLVHEAARVIREEEPRRLSTVDRIYRGDVETIVAKALEKEKTRRYQSANALAADLRRYLANEPIAARPAGAIYQLVKFARRHRATCAAMLGIAATLVLGAAAALWQAARATTAEHEAVAQAEKARAQEREARVEQRRAEQALAFAQGIFGGISPYVANGQDTKLLQTLLQQAESRITAELRELPEVEVAIRTTLATAYTMLALYPEAKKQIDKADKAVAPLGEGHRAARALLGTKARLQLREGDFAAGTASYEALWRANREHAGPDDRTTIEARSSWADALFRAGRFEQSVAESRQALADAKRVFGDDAPTTLSTLVTLAVAISYTERGEDSEAEALLRKVVEVRRRDLGPDALATWDAAGNLAMIMDRQLKGEGEKLTLEVREQFTRLLGPEHPQTLNVANNLGISYRRRGRHADAEAEFRKVAEARTRVLAPDHPDTLFAWANAAEEMVSQGKLDDGEELAQWVLDQRIRRIGNDHPQTRRSLFTLAEVRRQRGDHAGAAELLGRAAEATRRTHEPDDPALHIALYNWAATLQDAGETVRAEVAFREVLSLHEQHVGTDKPYIAASHNGLAKCLDKKGDFVVADQHFERGLAMRQRLLRAHHPDVAYSLLDHASALVDRKAWPEAERRAREAIENASGPTPHVLNLAKAQALLGAVMIGTARLDEAEPLLLAAERVLATPAERSYCRVVRLRLARLFDAREAAAPGNGHAARAAEWRTKAAEVSDK